VKDGLTVVKIGDLLARQGVMVPQRTLHRYCVAHTGYRGRRQAGTVPVADGEPGVAAPELFAVGLPGASLLAASVVPLWTSYAVADAIGAPRSVSARLRQAPLFYGIFTAQIVIGAAAALAPGNLVALVVNAQVLNGVITPLLLTYILTLANRSTVLGAAKNGPIFKAVATVCVAVVGLLSFVVLIQTVFGLG